ncbi:TRAP transporter permease [Chloroflexota bacterium]
MGVEALNALSPLHTINMIEGGQVAVQRELNIFWQRVVFWSGLVFAGFHLYTAGVGPLPDIQQRAVHIIFGLTLALITYTFGKRPKTEGKVSVPIWDIILIGIVLAANINIILKYKHVYMFPGESTTLDMVLGAMLMLLVFDIVRRVVGWVIPIMMALAFLYVFISPILPGIWKFRGLSLENVIEGIYYSTHGIYGAITGLSATLVAVFVIFGSLLMGTGAGQTFIDLALRIAGRFTGGPAKVAVVASAMFGTISGSCVANVAVTGNYTIPMMKRLGYKSEFAAAVEAAASNGGNLTPPIMGIAAFIMAEILEVSYLKIIFYATIPAVLYFTSIFTGVHLEAIRNKLLPVPRGEMPPWKNILTWSRLAPFTIPIIVLMSLLFQGWDITMAGFCACLAVMVVFLFTDLSPPRIAHRFLELGKALSQGGRALVQLATILISINMMINLLTVSGVTIKISGLITDVGEGNLLLGLIVGAIVPLLMGMAVVTTASYLLSAAIVAPALMTLGIELVPAHMFILYISCLAAVTPPVAPAVFVAATLAKSHWLKTAFIALRLSIIAFIIPFFFAMEPALLAYHQPTFKILLALFSGMLGAVIMSSGLFGYLRRPIGWFTRLLLIVGGISLLMVGWQSDLLGLLLAGFSIVAQPVISRFETFIASLVKIKK